MIKEYLSIVIPCKNEENYITQTLTEISLQHGISGTRVIIADGGSDDSTLEMVDDFIKSTLNNLDIEIIKGGTVSVGRNRGASLVKTDLILFLDADVTFTDLCAIEMSLSAIKKNVNIQLLGTTPEYRGERDLLAKLIFKINHRVTRIVSATDPFAVGAYMMIYSYKFRELGGFDENIHQSEDWMLSRKVNPKNFKLIPGLITQDNRRFKRFGYLKMLGMVIGNWFNRGDEKHFKKNVKYWD